MNFTDRIQGLFERIRTYPEYEVVLEFVIIWVVVFLIVRFVQGTRAAGALKGLLVLLVIATIVSRILGGGSSFARLGLLYDRFLALVAIGLIVIFQPELRRALVRLGETPFFRSTPKDISYVVAELVSACKYLSRSKFGAIMVLERETGLAGVVEGGTVLGAQLSARLLQTIFFPGSALHDLAVIIKGRTIHAAGVQLPLAEPGEMPDPSLGSRHRAALGVTKECDALVVVVSEETGSIRIAERGRLSKTLTLDELGAELRSRLTPALKSGAGQPDAPADPAETSPTESQGEEAAR